MTQTPPPEITNPEVELHKPQLSEPIVTTREPNALQYAIHVLHQLRKQGLWFTLLEIYDQGVRRIRGAPTERFTRITPQLHVGGQYSRKGWATLARRGISGAVSMRVGPGPLSPTVGQLEPCEAVTFLGFNQNFPGWVYVEDMYRQTGWVGTTNLSFAAGVEKMLFLGSSCIYPKFADQPIKEDALLTGSLEPTNEWYAIAKIAGIKLGQAYRKQYGADYISAMPTNLYGPGDNFDLNSSHVVPALIRKAHEAKLAHAPSFEIWGTGGARREFLHVDDCADALVLLMQRYSSAEHVNVGSGSDVSIAELAQSVADAVGFEGEITKDTTKPDGTPQKLMDASRMRALGWTPQIGLTDGLRSTYAWYLQNRA